MILNYKLLFGNSLDPINDELEMGISFFLDVVKNIRVIDGKWYMHIIDTLRYLLSLRNLPYNYLFNVLECMKGIVLCSKEKKLVNIVEIFHQIVSVLNISTELLNERGEIV